MTGPEPGAATLADGVHPPRAGARMQAAVYRGRDQVRLETVPVPRIGPGEVLLRVASCGICGTDIKKIRHGFVPPPQILGHEIAGTVVDTAGDTGPWRRGDRVVAFHHVPCGDCFYCRRGLYSQCTLYRQVGVTAGFEPSGGGFSEFVRVMPWIVRRGMVRIPGEISFDEASFVEPVNTCLKAVRKARIGGSETVLVMGQGPIGLLLLLVARLHGASVYGSDPLRERRSCSLELGAAECLDPAEQDLAEAMRARTGGRGADVVLVAVPSAGIVREAMAVARPGGRVLLFAHNDPQMEIGFPAAAVGVEEKEVLGSYSAAVDLQEESARLVFERRLPVARLISHRFPLHQFAQALSLAATPQGASLKIVINPEAR